MRAWARIPLQLATLGLLLFIAAAAVVTGAYYYVEPSLPTADELRAVQFQTPLRVNSRDGQLITQYGEEKRLIAEFEDIPQSVKNAIVAAEDDRFYQHSGIDLVSTLRAILNYGLSLVTGSGERVAGGSTITQQVPRTMELISRDYGVGRKVAEIFLAFRIEREFTKDEILGLYLNTYFFGQSSFGVVQAARTYFNKDLSDLTLSEVAIIAGIPTAPSVNNPYNSPANAERRRAYVLRRMEELDYIDAAERQQALAEPIISQKFGVELELDAGYIGDMAIGFCQARFGDRACREDGLVIYTTVESRAQRAGNAALRGALDAYDRNHGYRGPLGHFDLASIGLGEVVPASGDGPGVDRSPDPSNESGEAASSRVAFDPGSTEVLNTLLGDFPDRFEAEAGLVLSVDETQAEVYLRSAGVVQVGLDAVSWAAPYINDDRSGTAKFRRPARAGPGAGTQRAYQRNRHFR
jgi:penicillin-binding protein 1A